MGKSTQVFVVLVVLVAMLAGAAFLLPGDGTFAERANRFAFIGAPLLEVRLPEPGQQVPVGAIEVLVGFLGEERVAADTFRALVNGSDVTDQLTVGENGAGGSLLGLSTGRNRLRIEVFGRSSWGARYVLEHHLLEFHVRPIPYLDRAAGTARHRAS